MFHWICPECGREIPPAVKECPDCDPQAISATPPELPQLSGLAAAAPAPALAPKSPQVSPRESLLPAFVPPELRGFAPPRISNVIQTNSVPPELPVLAEALVPAAPATALLDPPAEIPAPQWPGPDFTKRTHQLLPPAQAPLLLGPASDRLGFAQVLPPPMVPNGLVPALEQFGPPPLPGVSVSAPPPPTLLPVDPTTPVLTAPVLATSPAVTSAAAASAPAPSAQLDATDPQPDLAVLAEAVEPEAVDAIEVGEEPGSSLPLARAAASAAPRVSAAVPPLAFAQPSRAFGPEPAAMPGLAPSCGNLPVPSPRLAGDQLRIPAARRMDAPGSRLGAASQTVLALPTEPGQPIQPGLQPTAAPPIGGLVDYSAGSVRAIRPIRPPQAWFVPPAEPRITLPGPMLPRELNSLAEAGLRTVHEAPRGARRRRSGSGRVWLALTAVTVVAAAAVFIVPALLSNGKPAAVQAEDAPSAEATPVPADVRPAGAYALSKTVEVTGFRFVVDLNSRSEIHYLVVNHSPAQFGGVTVYVTLREAAAKPGQPPVARFSFRAPEMGPYSSREMTSPIEKISRQVSLPDWQSLQAEVEIGE
ncbi:MAG TPA: hypothetical protein VN841_14365 [Bryobacteraceae bacterium]|nr:hypothetical protein [Bryobacteraceae bacterium]